MQALKVPRISYTCACYISMQEEVCSSCMCVAIHGLSWRHAGCHSDGSHVKQLFFAEARRRDSLTDGFVHCFCLLFLPYCVFVNPEQTSKISHWFFFQNNNFKSAPMDVFIQNKNPKSAPHKSYKHQLCSSCMCTYNVQFRCAKQHVQFRCAQHQNVHLIHAYINMHTLNTFRFVCSELVR